LPARFAPNGFGSPREDDRRIAPGDKSVDDPTAD
jgi:hypothetical protein